MVPMTILNNLARQIEDGNFEYNKEFIGYVVSSCASENQDGMFYPVYLEAIKGETYPYAKHTIKIGKNIISCHEYTDFQKKWYLNDEEFDVSLFNEINKLLDNIIVPLNFEHYAINNFDYDAVGESVPYGDPYCLIADGCVFMIEEGGQNFTKEDVIELLKSYNWSEERIDSIIDEDDGYEITSDVWNSICDLPIVYSEYDE